MNLGLLGTLALLAAFACLCGGELRADPCCDPDSPFREGEGWADTPATCETIARWAARAPETDARITMVMEGRLAEVHWDGALAYLIVCEAPGTQVLCVTYETNGLEPGDVAVVAGGYQRAGPQQVILDPCLAARE